MRRHSEENRPQGDLFNAKALRMPITQIFGYQARQRSFSLRTCRPAIGCHGDLAIPTELCSWHKMCSLLKLHDTHDSYNIAPYKIDINSNKDLLCSFIILSGGEDNTFPCLSCVLVANLNLDLIWHYYHLAFPLSGTN